MIYQLFTSTVRIIKSTAETLLQTQGIITDFLGHNKKIRRYLLIPEERWDLTTASFILWQGNMVLSARASFQFPCSVRYFFPPCLWYSSCHLSTLALCSHSPHLIILSLLSLIKDVLPHLISPSCFFYFDTSLLILSYSYSNLSTPICESISASASHPQTRIHISVLLDTLPSTSAVSPSFLSDSLNLQYLSLSTPFKFYSCPSEFKSGRILLKPTALKAAGWQYKGEGVLALTLTVSAPACSSPQLQLHWKSY